MNHSNNNCSIRNYSLIFFLLKLDYHYYKLDKLINIFVSKCFNYIYVLLLFNTFLVIFLIMFLKKIFCPFDLSTITYYFPI